MSDKSTLYDIAPPLLQSTIRIVRHIALISPSGGGTMFAQNATNRKPDLQVASEPGASRDDVILRRSAPGDGPAISRLARLESRRPAAGPYVLAERGGEVVAAVPLDGGSAIADPFMLTADLVAILELRARQLMNV